MMNAPQLLVRFWSFALAFTAAAAGQEAAGGDWQEHVIRQGDGEGRWVTRPALRQVLRHPDCEFTMPFGLAKMDNGEIAILVSREKSGADGGRIVEPNIAFSRDGGATWSSFAAIPGTRGRPQYLHCLGGGRLSFVTEPLNGGGQQRFFSSDYGRHWNESIAHPPTEVGYGFALEGNGWVDCDDSASPTAVLELGWHYAPGKSHPRDDATVVFRRSTDDGRTWIDEVTPSQWMFTIEHGGRKWLRGVSEGAIVRAANGDLVAALRTDMPPRYFDGPHDDSLEGTAISVSKDDGRTWSALKFLFDAGRHHANLQRLPNGDIVCTLVVRDDIQNGKLVSHRRGCDALISHDHGRTWNLRRRYELDSYAFLRDDGYWVDGACGHVSAIALDDGQVLSVYGRYRQGAVLIKWKPDGPPAERLPAPIRAEVGLFDQSLPGTLGLPAVPAEPVSLYEAVEDSLRYSHHPNLGVFENRLYAMWSGGIEHEDDNGQRVLYCRTEDGLEWSDPQVLAEDPDGDGPLACVAAGFHATADNLTAYYTTITARHATWEQDRLHASVSTDGKSWSQPQPLFRGFFIESPRALRSGRVLMNGQWTPARPRLMFTNEADGLSGWRDSQLPEVGGFQWPEPSWFQREDGTIVMLFRRQTADAKATLYASTSADDGGTWTPPTETDFPDATSRIAAGNLPDGTAFIINNPSHTPDEHFRFIGRRNPLVISLSHDGITFDRARVIRGEPTTIRFSGPNLKADGWQYPAALVWNDHLYVICSVNKEDVAITRISLQSLYAMTN